MSEGLSQPGAAATTTESSSQRANTSATTVRRNGCVIPSTMVVVNHGRISKYTAGQIWNRFLQTAGVGNVSADSVRIAVALALLQASSQERDYDEVFVTVEKVTFSLGLLRAEAAKECSADNPIRVWARSYDDAAIPKLMTDILATPQNLAQRQEAALKYNCSMEDVKFAHDLADALMTSGREYTMRDRSVINGMRAYGTQKAQNRAAEKGQSFAPPDSGARSKRLEETVPTVVSSSERVRMTSMK